MIATKENSLIVELRTFAKLIGEEGRQAEFYRQMLKDAKPIEVVRLSEVFTDTEIRAIKRFVNPKVKECYRNATLFSHIYPEVKYVEGKPMELPYNENATEIYQERVYEGDFLVGDVLICKNSEML